MKKVTVLGAGSWGTALAILLAKHHKGQIRLWCRQKETALIIEADRESKEYLPEIHLPEDILVSTDLKFLLADTDLVVFAVPSHAFRNVLEMAWPLIPNSALIVNAAKGIEVDTLLRQSEVFLQVTGEHDLRRYAALSGPSHAEEVGRDIPTAVVVSSPHQQTAEQIQDFLITPSFRVYTNPDITGVELGGALKNIIAIATGIADGLGLGDNPRAALMTRGLAEITRLGVKMGANPLTFGGLSGIGDLIVTCTSYHSRNRRAGIEIGRGCTTEQAQDNVRMVVEGVRTTNATYLMAQETKVEMPITEQTYRVLFEDLCPKQALKNLMHRSRTNEIEEVANISVSWTRTK